MTTEIEKQKKNNLKRQKRIKLGKGRENTKIKNSECSSNQLLASK